MGTEPEEASFVGFKRPSISLFTPIYFASEKRSPMGPIPPITVSNPAETYKSAEREREAAEAAAREREREKEKEAAQPQEKKSVMREILAFVRKPSKHLSSRTNRFANAFTRAESGSSGGPLIRQSTFSASPAASSTAAKSAVQKQMSEVGFEPKISQKFTHYAKMSLRLRRSTKRDDEEKDKDKEKEKQKQGSASGSKRPSADLSQANVEQQVGGSSDELPFELANVHFEKVGESYIKHERLRELQEPEADKEEDTEQDAEPKAEAEVEQTDAAMAQFVEEVTNSLNVVALNGEGGAAAVHHFTRRSESREPIEPRISEERESDSNDLMIPDEMRAELVEILKAYAPEPVYVNLQALRRETEDADLAIAQAEAAVLAASLAEPAKKPLQCPTIEFEPPSRRSSFDPPRSPFLEQLRSPGVDTETDLINLQRLDSGGDSFELVESKWSKSSRGESSFDCPYSSRDTSFDVSISRYQSTSYEDQTSSFEIVDTDEKAGQGKRAVDLRKSSIELVDAETFQRSGSSCGGRKSSLETHFDYTPTEGGGGGGGRSPSLRIVGGHE